MIGFQKVEEIEELFLEHKKQSGVEKSQLFKMIGFWLFEILQYLLILNLSTRGIIIISNAIVNAVFSWHIFTTIIKAIKC